MPIDGPLMAIDGPHGTAMAIDELQWDLSTGRTKCHRTEKTTIFLRTFDFCKQIPGESLSIVRWIKTRDSSNCNDTFYFCRFEMKIPTHVELSLRICTDL